MIVSDLSRTELVHALTGPGLNLHMGPLVVNVVSPISAVIEGIALHYAAHSIDETNAFVDFRVRVAPPSSLRRWIQPQVTFQLDGENSFAPLPIRQAFPMLEWGLNWCVASYCYQYITIHAAVVEKSGRALILPAPPGSGKSTLCAGLVNHGWRLLSDELTLIERDTRHVVPMPRPVSLKNNSIAVMKNFATRAKFGPDVHDTIKGTVGYMQPPALDVSRAAEWARPGWLVLPKYEAGAVTALTPLPKGQALIHLADNAFNYPAHGLQGFETLVSILEDISCFRFLYSNLAEAIEVFDQLAKAK